MSSWQNSCKEWYRYPAGTLSSVRGRQVSGRYPEQCQGYTGTLQVS